MQVPEFVYSEYDVGDSITAYTTDHVSVRKWKRLREPEIMKNNHFNCFDTSKNNQFDCFFLYKYELLWFNKEKAANNIAGRWVYEKKIIYNTGLHNSRGNQKGAERVAPDAEGICRIYQLLKANSRTMGKKYRRYLRTYSFAA